jgi:Calcineurin-like phosphoesterase
MIVAWNRALRAMGSVSVHLAHSRPTSFNTYDVENARPARPRGAKVSKRRSVRIYDLPAAFCAGGQRPVTAGCMFRFRSLHGAVICQVYARLVWVLALVLSGCIDYAPPTSSGDIPRYRAGEHFTAIGDLQRTLPEEEWFLGRENNDDERELLLPEVARTSPAFVVMLGDLVSDGSSTRQWQEFDQRSASLRQARIPVLPVLGNHEYLFGRGGLWHYYARFPRLEHQHWYARNYGPAALVFLDSNVSALSVAEWAEQKRWFEATLRHFDRDPAVLGVLVFLHHAPFTNASNIGDDIDVQQAFVGSFLNAGKTMAMVTGHAHGYERFEHCGKSFVVSGGGGGPRVPLLEGKNRRHPDDKFRGPALRNFNFVEFAVRPSGIHADVVGLPKGTNGFCRMEQFDLDWPMGATAGGAPSRSADPPERILQPCTCE